MLKTLDRKSEFKFERNFDRYQKILDKLTYVNNMELPHSSQRVLEFMDSIGSVAIEGYNADLLQLMANDTRRNNQLAVYALEACKHMGRYGVSQKSLKKANAIVLGECGDGQYRDKMVYGGNETEIVFTPAKVEDVPELMYDLFCYSSHSVILDSIIYHFYTAYVHPFLDGNGRTVRAMNTGMLSDKPLPLSKAISCRRSAYYKAIQECEQTADLTCFIQFMLERIEVACDIYKAFHWGLSMDEVLLLYKIDRPDRGEISKRKAEKMLGDSVAGRVLQSLCDKKFLIEMNDVYQLMWR